MKTKVTIMALFATLAFFAQTPSKEGDLLPLHSPKTPKNGTPPKVDVPRIVDPPKIDVPRLNDADDDLLDIKPGQSPKPKTDDLLPLKSESSSGSENSRTDVNRDGVNGTLTIKNKGNQTTQPQQNKDAIGVIKEKNNGTLINPIREKDEAPEEGFTKVKGTGTLTQPNVTKETTTGEIKTPRSSSNPNGTEVKAPNENVKNENNPIKSNKNNATVTTKNPKDRLGTKQTNEEIKEQSNASIEQVKNKATGKDLIKTMDKTPKNDKPKVNETNESLPAGEKKVKDDKIEKE